MKIKSLTIIAVIFLLTGINFSQQNEEKIRIGTFDSRCIAIAYGRSDDFKKEMDSIKTELFKAKEEGNDELIKKIEHIGPRRQVLLHQQGFSNGSIINILNKMKDEFPKIAAENNVQMIMSKWEVMFADESIELIDITDQLIEYFNPNEKTRNIIEQVKLMDPVPIEEISVNPKD
jgi:Skp family chaperone for outer membrane proteins